MALTQVTGGLIASGQTITTPTISGYLNLATWTTGTRPGTPVAGQAGFNTTLGVIEAYNGTAWVSGGGLNQQAVQTSGFTAVAGNSYPCNTTSSAFTVTLPASPIAGNQVGIIDYAGTFATNILTIGRNGSNITGVASNYVLLTNRESVILTYIDSTQGWVVSSAAYTTTPITIPTYTATYLVVGGGAGGAGDYGGGGGAGGYLTGTFTATFLSGTVYTATVGAGSPGTNTASTKSTNGSNSSLSGSNISTITALGGGGASAEGTSAGSSGGSGGGGSYLYSGGAGTPGQGNAGGAGGGSVAPNYVAGGGGGSGAVGSNGSGSTTGAGGTGTANSITGTPVTYAGGGGGGHENNNAGSTGQGGTNGGPAGSPGGGGNGGAYPSVTGSSGTANTGGGGGGGLGDLGVGGNGGSGVVILSVPTVNYSGNVTGSPTVTTSGSNTIIKWTTAGSGTYTA